MENKKMPTPVEFGQPSFDHHSSISQDGDLALMVNAQKKRFLIRLARDDQLHTHRGILKHIDLIGKRWGTRVYSHLGSPFLLLQPSLADLLFETKRNTQIMYPKDVGFVLVNLDIGAGKRVLEAGSGSGAFTTSLAYMVGEQGHVYSYDQREAAQNLARKNIAKVGLENRVTFKQKDIAEGFDEIELDALFLDVPNPYDYLVQVRAALKSGGFFGCILPTMNQVTTMINALHREKFSFIDICEILLRYYKTSAQRLRPTDRMVAHTGYLIFARPIIDILEEEPTSEEDEIDMDPL
jgi:tRNA (adenine57-N1/adenine58-N1)-methyltransferase catalytic subunit